MRVTFLERKVTKRTSPQGVLTAVDVTCFQQAENSIRQAEFAEILLAKFQPAIPFRIGTV